MTQSIETMESNIREQQQNLLGALPDEVKSKCPAFNMGFSNIRTRDFKKALLDLKNVIEETYLAKRVSAEWVVKEFVKWSESRNVDISSEENFARSMEQQFYRSASAKYNEYITAQRDLIVYSESNYEEVKKAIDKLNNQFESYIEARKREGEEFSSPMELDLPKEERERIFG